MVTAGDITRCSFCYNNAEEVIDGLNLHIESGKLRRWTFWWRVQYLRFIAAILR